MPQSNVVKVEREGEVLAYLFQALPQMKKTVLKQRLKYSCISINGRIAGRHDDKVMPGDVIRVESSRSRVATPALQFNIEIVYEDEAIIVINKPSGLLTVASEKIQRETAIFSVNDYLNKQAARKHREPELRKRVFIVHRLDRDVSGLLVMAKNESAKNKLQTLWDRFKKEYLAVVEGKPQKNSGTITSYLNENKILRIYSTPRPLSPESKKSITHYEVLKPGTNYSLVKVRLETGRRHQIRVHLADLGHPIAGDMDYGAKTNPAGRIALHATRLEFQHPATGKTVVFNSPFPPQLARLG